MKFLAASSNKLLLMTLVLVVKTSIALLGTDQKDTKITPAIHEAWWDNCLEKTVSMETFASWLGDTQSPSRCAMRKHVAAKKYTNLLDVPCGLCIDYYGLKQDNINVIYNGLDLCQKLVTKAQEKGISVSRGSIEKIPYGDNFFDVVYARHILEHLPSYELAINELVRVGKKEVLVVFFIKPAVGDVVNYQVCDGNPLYHNQYDKERFEQYVLANSKVKELDWEVINEKEEIAHIYLSIDNKS